MLMERPDRLLGVLRGTGLSLLGPILASTGLAREAVIHVVQIPLRTLARRKGEGRLRPDESDRLVRAARIFSLAVELFDGNDEPARRWLTQPQPALGGSTPWDYAATDIGLARSSTWSVGWNTESQPDGPGVADGQGIHADHAFDGEGSAGTAADERARACPSRSRLRRSRWPFSKLWLTFSRQLHFALRHVHGRFAERLIEDLELATLPADWRNSPAPSTLQALGDAWIRRGSSVLLACPAPSFPTNTTS